MAGLSEIADAVVKIADSLDRAVFLFEAWSNAMGVVHPDDVGLEYSDEE